MTVQTGQTQGDQNNGSQQGQQQQQGQSDQTSGGQGDGGTNAGTQVTNLLDDESTRQQGDQQGDQTGGTGDEGGAATGAIDIAAITASVTAALEARFDSIADRRVNALLKAQNRNTGQQQQGQGGQQQGQGQQQQQAPEHDGPNVADVREARAEYREAVSDEITFLGTQERSVAADLAASLIQMRLASGEDPTQAGLGAARDVAVKVKALRKHYEDRTIAALRRKGLLAADGRGDGQIVKGDPNPGSASGFKAGADKAAAMFPERMPKQQ